MSTILENRYSMEVLSNFQLGSIITIFGIIIIFVGHHFRGKIGVFHVLIYFMAVFVLLTGVLLLFAYDISPIFFN
jgi:hypothetical protein